MEIEKNWEELKKEGWELVRDLSHMVGEKSDIVLKLKEKLDAINRIDTSCKSLGLVKFRITDLLVKERYFLSYKVNKGEKIEISEDLASWMLAGLFEGLEADIREAKWMLNQLRNAAPWNG